MQLLSMEVNQLGTADRTQVGVLSAGLNAVCGRRGSGKSSLIRWLRGMIEPQDGHKHNGFAHDPYHLDRYDHVVHNGSTAAMAEAAGRLSLRMGQYEVQLERSQRAGKTDSKKVLRHATDAWNGHPNSVQAGLHASASQDVLSQLQRTAFDRLSAIDSDVNAMHKLWDVVRELQLDNTTRPRYDEERATLHTREQELLVELKALDGLRSTREGLLARRRQIESELERTRRQSGGRHALPSGDEHHRQSDRLSALNRDMQRIRDEIADLDAAILRAREDVSHQTLASSDHRSYRARLLSLDAQLARWRNTLTEIRGNRERLEAAATDAQLDGQLGEQFSPINQADPRLALRSLEAQIVDARRHFDSMLAGVERYRDEYDTARNELPQTLRLMQRELHEVCQQLSRHESLNSGRAMRDQILQLTRCESEMRLAIERLIAERGELLRSIATACHLSVDQVTVAYSDSCRCADHPHLDAWLSAISTSPTDAMNVELAARSDQLLNMPGMSLSSMNASGLDRLSQLEAQRKHALARLDEAQHDHRDTEARLRRLGGLPVATPLIDHAEAALLRDLDLTNEELQRLESRDRLRVELSDIRRRLQSLPADTADIHSLRGRYARHLAVLTGQHRDPAVASSGRTADRWDWISGNLNANTPTNMSMNLPAHVLPQVEQRLEEIALRLAICEVLTARGHHVPMILDETLDGLEAPFRLAAVRYLSAQAEVSRQQIIAMTDDKEVVEAVRSVRGNVIPVVVSRAVHTERRPVALDINRQLTAFANDVEADKWSTPEWTPPVVTRESKRRWMLTERSEIEQVPSIGASHGARLRTLGIDRVADLLDADANWVADNARIASVDDDMVHAWQNECRLLCAMPQLRPFDARILAGAGVRDQHQLTETEPGRLLERVERFLGTERGRQIMRSGNNYELSRLTSWIASAKRGHKGEEDGPTLGIDPNRTRVRSSKVVRSDAAHHAAPTYHVIERDDVDSSNARDQEVRADRRRPRRERPDRSQRTDRDRSTGDRGQRERLDRASANGRTRTEDNLRFYLELTSPVVDAPSIGDSMARSLAKVGIQTINDLLTANADSVAQRLAQPRVTAAIIEAWQDQARLVCRIPNLRGHDAQILVACGITTPEALIRVDAESLLAQTTKFAESNQGQRVLRGSQAPDLAEIKDWITWAGQSRNLMAA